MVPAGASGSQPGGNGASSWAGSRRRPRPKRESPRRAALRQGAQTIRRPPARGRAGARPDLAMDEMRRCCSQSGSRQRRAGHDAEAQARRREPHGGTHGRSMREQRQPSVATPRRTYAGRRCRGARRPEPESDEPADDPDASHESPDRRGPGSRAFKCDRDAEPPRSLSAPGRPGPSPSARRVRARAIPSARARTGTGSGS